MAWQKRLEKKRVGSDLILPKLWPYFNQLSSEDQKSLFESECVVVGMLRISLSMSAKILEKGRKIDLLKLGGLG